MFPISIEGTLDIWANSEDALLNLLKDAFAAKGARFIERKPDKLAFIGRVCIPDATIYPPFFTNRSLNPLLMFDRCVVSAQHEKLRYKCSTRFALIVVTVMAILVWFAMLAATQPSIPLPIVLIFPPFMWLGVVSLNYVAARNRFRQFLEDVVWGPETSKP
jgi:hypothetical protein